MERYGFDEMPWNEQTPAGFDYGLPAFTVTDTAGFSLDPINALSSGVPQIGNDAQASPATSIYDLITRALSVYQLDRQQRAFLETNRELVLQGRAPLAWDQFQPTASVGVSVDKNTQRILMFAVAGAVGIGLLSVLMNRRRS